MRAREPADADHYATLGLAPSASDEDVRHAFKTLIRRHRERPGETDLAVIDRARQINIAHYVLGEPIRRRTYDESRGKPVERQQVPSIAPVVVSDVSAQPTRPAFFQAASGGDSPRDDDGEAVPVDVNRAGVANEEAAQEAPTTRRKRGPLLAIASLAAVALLVGLNTVYSVTDGPTMRSGTGVVREPGGSGRNTVPGVTAEPQIASSSVGNAGVPSPGLTGGTVETSPIITPAPSVEHRPILSAVRPAVPDTRSPSPASRALKGSTKEASAAALALPGRAAKVEATAKAVSPPASGAGPAATSSSAPDKKEAPAPPAAAMTASSSGGIATPARHIGGSLIDASKPVGRLRGTSSVRFTVDRDGRATHCQTTGGSGNAALGSITCQLVEDRLRFSPATDAAGRPTSSEVSTTFNWEKKPRP